MSASPASNTTCFKMRAALSILGLLIISLVDSTQGCPTVKAFVDKALVNGHYMTYNVKVATGTAAVENAFITVRTGGWGTRAG